MTLSNTCQIINNNTIENTMQFLDKDIIIIYYHQYYFMNIKHIIIIIIIIITYSLHRKH